MASLAVGLFPYSAFLLLARAFYALGDSRTPGVVALVAAAVGVAAMLAGVVLADGAARVAALGLGHSAGLRARCGRARNPAAPPDRGRRRARGAFVRIVAVAAAVGLAAWVAQRALLPDDPSRLGDIAFVAATGLVGAAVVVGGYRLLGVAGSLTARARRSRAAPDATVALPEPQP